MHIINFVSNSTVVDQSKGSIWPLDKKSIAYQIHVVEPIGMDCQYTGSKIQYKHLKSTSV